MICMKFFSSNYKILSNDQPNLEIISQEVKYEKDEEFEEVRRDLEHFDNKSNLNMSKIKTINWGDYENIKETKIGLHDQQKNEDII